MARPLRIRYADAYYHVMNRGNRGEAIFITDSDRATFLDGLADSCETYAVNLIGYILMGIVPKVGGSTVNMCVMQLALKLKIPLKRWLISQFLELKRLSPG